MDSANLFGLTPKSGWSSSDACGHIPPTLRSGNSEGHSKETFLKHLKQQLGFWDKCAGFWHNVFRDLRDSQVKEWRRQWHPTPVLLPGKSHGRRSLVGCSPWGHQESDMTERLHFHFSLSQIGEGNGNPLQYSCLDPRDGGAWWATVFGVAQSWTQLKWLSSSSSSSRWKRNFSWLVEYSL